MSVTELLIKITEQGIYLSANHHYLILQYPKGSLSPQLRTEIVAHKSEVLRLSPLSICPQIDFLSHYLAGEAVPELEKLQL